MKPNKASGQCRLTGDVGPFVKSHLIPLALTKLSGTGKKFIETGIGEGRMHRANSWYDYELVTREGEDILAAIDTRGIELLREHRLVWSGWGGMSLSEERLTDFYLAFRIVAIEEPSALQLFFLSLLWRAGASSRREFKDVELSTAILDDLAARITRRDPGNFLDYPVQLYQLSTKGIPHNRTPLLERKRTVGYDLKLGPEVDYVRFYFDGLVAHVHLGCGTSFVEGLENSFLRAYGPTVIFQNPFHSSRTLENFREAVTTADREHLTPPGTRHAVYLALAELWPPAHLNPLNTSTHIAPFAWTQEDEGVDFQAELRKRVSELAGKWGLELDGQTVDEE